MSTEKSPKADHQELLTRDSVFHCHHYNCFLQRTIQDPEYIDTASLLSKSAAEATYSHFKEFIDTMPGKESSELLKIAEEVCQHRGYGIIDLGGITERGGRVVAKVSHYGLSWLKKFGKSDKQVCHFLSGYIRGVLTAVYNKEFTATETLCYGKGDGSCIFEVYEGAGESLLDYMANETKNQITEVIPASPGFRGNLDINYITKTVAGLGLGGNEDGLIDAFGVYLVGMYSDYYNKISYGFEKMLEEASSMSGLAQPLLAEAGHVCGFNTFGGIMKSPEWDALVVQNAKNKMDWVEGMIAVINGLGWGTWVIKELVDDKKLVIHTYNGYEALGYRKYYGMTDRAKCYMTQGTTSAIMNLIYLGNIESKPDLTESFYDDLFSGENSFFSTETKCYSKGDGFCEFVVERY